MAVSLRCFDEMDPERFVPLDPLDGRFQAVASQVLTGHYERAAAEAEALFREGAYDVRLACYILLGGLHGGGVGDLPRVLDAVQALLGPRWELLGPQEEKSAEVGRSLDWLCNQITTYLRALQRGAGAGWREWVQALDVGGAKALVAQGEALITRLEGRGAPQALPSAEALTSWMRRLARDIAMGEELEATGRDDGPEAAGPGAADGPFEPRTPSTLSGLGSPELTRLIQRLQAFEVLCEEKDFAKAAVLIDGLRAALEGFDPHRYLPGLFGPFYAVGAQHVIAIERARDRTDPLVFQQLERLYQVDLQAFIQLNLQEDDDEE